MGITDRELDQVNGDFQRNLRKYSRGSFLGRAAAVGGAALGAGTLSSVALGSGRSASAAPFPGDAAFEKAAARALAGRTIKIGFTPAIADELFNIMIGSAQAQLRVLEQRFGLKWQMQVVNPAGITAATDHANIMEAWATKGYDAALICPDLDLGTLNRLATQGLKKGMHTFPFNWPAELFLTSGGGVGNVTEKLAVDSVIGYNNAMQAGYLVGNYVAEKLQGKGNLAQIWGSPSYWATSRDNGLKYALKSHPGIKVVANQRADYDRGKALTVTRNLLQVNRNINAFYGENDNMAQGAGQAIDVLGLKHWDGKSGIMTVGANGTKYAYQLIKQGKLTATVDVNPTEQGIQMANAIFWRIGLGYAIDPIINVPTRVVDKTNVDVPLAYVTWALQQMK